MGELKVGILDFNDNAFLIKLLSLIKRLIENHTSYFTLKFKPKYYFEILNGSAPQERGWYVILDGTRPVYVGKADDLNSRLNTNH